MNTTPTKKARIVLLKDQGESNRAVAAKEDVDPSTVSRIYGQYGKTCRFYEKKHRSGRPHKLNDYDVQIGRCLLSNGSAQNAADLQQKQFPHTHVDTVHRALRNSGLNAHIHRKKPLLKPVHKTKRRKWAWAHGLWEEEDWHAVWFPDESKFNLFGSDGHQWCWRKPGEEFRDVNVQKTVKHGGGSIVVWGCITPWGVGRLHHIDGLMDAKKYIGILNTSLLGTLQDYSVEPQAIYFQQDRDPKHTSKLASAWFASKHLDLLDWPPNSPDMNIIENLWDHLDRMVRAHSPLPTNLNQLWEVLQEEWGLIDQAYIDKLYGSMVERVNTLRKAKGGETRY